ncbi:MAG: ABC transporter substrate binding protein, partial [Candidatus Binatia bacterium]
MKRALLSLVTNSFGIAAVAALLAFNTADAAASVIIVKSDDIPQYDVQIEAFRMAAPWETKEINIAGSRDRGTKLIRQVASTEDLQAVFALGVQAAWLSRQLLPDTPMVYAMVLDSNREMLDGNKTTGVAVEIPVADLLTRFKLIMPELERIGVIYSETSAAAFHDEAHEIAAQLGLDLADEVVSRSDEVAGAYRRLRTEVEALWMIPDPTVVTRDNFSYLAQRCRNDDIAFLAFSENFV